MVSLLHEYVTRSAEKDPTRAAVVMGEERLTYGELDAASNQLARVLLEHGCRRGDRVCVLSQKSPAAILGMVATLKADSAYVPIDVASPAARVERILTSAEPRLILASPSAAALVADLAATGASRRDGAIVLLEEPLGDERFEYVATPADWASRPSGPLSYAAVPDDLAHILFTSGSTGVPKGVMITHSNVLAFIEWATAYFGIKASDRISCHPPLHFDMSTFDIYGSFSKGAELHLVPPDAALVPDKLAALIREAQLTQWFSVPAVFNYMAKFGVVREDSLASLERVIWCGEVLPTPTLVHWMERLPSARFTNLYGPTEATIASSCYTVPELPSSKTAAVPIGRACGGEELAVLGPDMRAAAADEIADLYIGGVGLSPGYWRDQVKTDAAFVAHPSSANPRARLYRTGDLARIGKDGLIYFVGRADAQVKSRGYRIELGEIEAALNGVEVLKESAVVGVELGGFEGTTICCAYSPATKQDVTAASLRSRLSRSLPVYMLPSRWLAFDDLPKNVNGKIDRRRLKELFEERPSAPPRAEATATAS